MILNKAIPLLFGSPSSKTAMFALLSSLCVVVIAITAYLLAEISEEFPYFIVTSVLLGIHGYICLKATRLNILYIFRYFLVWILIFSTSIIWAIYPGEVYVAPFGLQFQTEYYTKLLVLGGVLSLTGSLIGWSANFIRQQGEGNVSFSLPFDRRGKLRLIGLMLAGASSALYVWKAGGFIIGDKSYADGQVGFTLEFGVFNIFHFTGISLMLIGSLKEKIIDPKYLLISILTLIPGMLVGSRADFLPQAFILLLLVFNLRAGLLLEHQRILVAVKYVIIFLVIFVIAFLLATWIAIWRTGINPISALSALRNSEVGILINSIYGHKMLYLETGNMMLGGFYSAIVQVQEGYTGLLLGESYFKYLLISPPAFFGLPRPLGLEWATAIDGIVMTQGGIFEVAEAYWNFGLAGCFLISCILSYSFGWLLKRGVTANNYFFLVWYMVFGLHGFRSIWYQNFGYFRLMTVMLVIYVACVFFGQWFIANRKNSVYGTLNQSSSLNR